MHRPLIALVFLAGCKNDPAECRKQADELVALLDAADTGGQLFQIAPTQLVLRTDLPKQDLVPAPTVTLNATDIVYQGSLVTLDELGDRLEATVAAIKDGLAMGRGPRHHPRDVFFVIDRATPWSVVAGAVTAAQQAGMTEPAFVFAVPNSAKRPPRTKLDDDIDKLGRDGSRATHRTRSNPSSATDARAS